MTRKAKGSGNSNTAEKTAKQLRSAPRPAIEQTLFRLRVRYVKQGRLAYLGHLEVIHSIERAIRRAGLPYAVSQGFSPHMRVGYTSALPVGTSSTCEWFDVFLTALVPGPEALERLVRASAPDLRPVQAGYVGVRDPALTALITRVGYRIDLFCGMSLEELKASMVSVSELAEIPYERSGKRKVLDLAKTLGSWELEPAGEGAFHLVLHTRADNEGSLRPEILLARLDRELRGSTDAIASTGIQDLESIPVYRVERIYQRGVGEHGATVDPL